MRWAHLSQDFIQPLEGAVQVYLNPAGGAGNILAMVFCSPALDEAHAYGTHFRQLVDRLEAMVHRLCQQLSKFLVIKNFQATPARDLAHSGGVKSVMVVAVPTLHKDAAVTEALGVHLPSDVVKVDSFSNMPPGVFNSGIPVNIGEQPKAETVLIVGRISETIHQHTRGGGMECLTHTVVELIVDNRAPVFWFLISNYMNISSVDIRGQ